MLMTTKSISDLTLLLNAGFCTQFCELDIPRAAAFFAVSERTLHRWIKFGMPERARIHLEAIFHGEFLPWEWRRRGLRVSNDGVYLPDGRFVALEVLVFWQFIGAAVDWSKVPRLCYDKASR